VVGLEDFADGAVARGNHLVASRLDGDAVTDDFLGEDTTSGTSSMGRFRQTAEQKSQ
jgi:hypothetical protein